MTTIIGAVIAAIGLAGLFNDIFTFNRTFKQSQEIRNKDVTKEILFPLMRKIDLGSRKDQEN